MQNFLKLFVAQREPSQALVFWPLEAGDGNGIYYRGWGWLPFGDKTNIHPLLFGELGRTFLQSLGSRTDNCHTGVHFLEGVPSSLKGFRARIKPGPGQRLGTGRITGKDLNSVRRRTNVTYGDHSFEASSEVPNGRLQQTVTGTQPPCPPQNATCPPCPARHVPVWGESGPCSLYDEGGSVGKRQPNRRR
ncbi:unnamed protein product [Calypogeia fissa]